MARVIGPNTFIRTLLHLPRIFLTTVLSFVSILSFVQFYSGGPPLIQTADGLGKVAFVDGVVYLILAIVSRIVFRYFEKNLIDPYY